MDQVAIITQIVDMSLKMRILRDRDRSRIVRAEFGDRELTVLELVASKLGPFTEREVGGILGLPTSSAGDLVKKLVKADVLKKGPATQKEDGNDSDGRARPLLLTPKGEAVLKTAKQKAAQRYAALFTKFTPDDYLKLFDLFTKLQEALDKNFQEVFFPEADV